jgi:hypothetical protein
MAHPHMHVRHLYTRAVSQDGQHRRPGDAARPRDAAWPGAGRGDQMPHGGGASRLPVRARERIPGL